MLVEIEAQSSVEATIPMLAPLRGPPFIGHESPQVPEAHGVWVLLADVELEMVVVNPVTEQPLAVTVVTGEQVVVDTMEPLVLKEVGTHCTVTCNTVFEAMHDDADDDGELCKVLVDESEFESLLELLSSSSSLVRSLFSDVKSSKESSMASTSSELMLFVMLSRSSSIQDNVFTISSNAPSKPLFLFEPHPDEDETPPRSEMRSSTSSLTGLILLRVSDLSNVGFAFQELMIGIRPASSEDTEETLDVAWELARVVVIGGRVIGDEYDPPLMTGTVSVVPDCMIVTATIEGAPNVTL